MAMRPVRPVILEEGECLDDKLYDLVEKSATHYRIGHTQYHVRDALAAGANPNYRPKDADKTTVELAASSQFEIIFIPMFLDIPATDFNPRPGHEDKSPLLSLIQISTNSLPDIYCIRVLRRITAPVLATSRVFQMAITHERYTLANALITAANGAYLVEPGLLHLCCLCNHDKQASRLAKNLIAAGYKHTTPYSTGSFPSMRKNVIEMAVELHAWYTLELVLPFAHIRLFTLETLIEHGFSQIAIELLDRFDLCSAEPIPGQLEDAPRFLLRKMLRRFNSERQFVIAEIMAQPDNARDLFRTRHNASRTARVLSCRSLPRFSLDLRASLIFALIRQGADLHESMMQFPEFRNALQPWTPRATRVYFPRQFRQHAFHIVLAIQLSPACHMPLEMTLLVIVFASRAYTFK